MSPARPVPAPLLLAAAHWSAWLRSQAASAARRGVPVRISPQCAAELRAYGIDVAPCASVDVPTARGWAEQLDPPTPYTQLPATCEAVEVPVGGRP